MWAGGKEYGGPLCYTRHDSPVEIYSDEHGVLGLFLFSSYFLFIIPYLYGPRISDGTTGFGFSFLSGFTVGGSGRGLSENLAGVFSLLGAFFRQDWLI